MDKFLRDKTQQKVNFVAQQCPLDAFGATCEEKIEKYRILIEFQGGGATLYTFTDFGNLARETGQIVSH